MRRKARGHQTPLTFGCRLRLTPLIKTLKTTFAAKILLLMLLPVWITMLYIGVYEYDSNAENISIFNRLISQQKYNEARSVFLHIDEISPTNKNTLPMLEEAVENEFTSFSEALIENPDLDIENYKNIVVFEQVMDSVIKTKFEEISEMYINEQIDYATAMKYFETMKTIGFPRADEQVKSINGINTGRMSYNAALKNMAKGDYNSAILEFGRINEQDTVYHKASMEKIAECTDLAVIDYNKNVDSLMKSNEFTQALNLLNEAINRFPDKEELLAKAELCLSLQKEWEMTTLVEYNGVVEHIFFHPLIVYPELAFDNDYQAKGFDDYFVTVKEFNRILDNLYSKDFILIDINSMVEGVEEDGKLVVKKKKLMLPQGKKPLVISIDDMNYYEYMIENGTIHKLVLTEDGKVADYIEKGGEKIVSFDNGIVPILDEFVRKHPDFSFNGAKGLIALTGYEGILGYRTHKGSPNREEEQKAVLPLIQKLKDTGWAFACHGYGHLDSATTKFENLSRDTKRWKEEVESLIGPTKVYIYPFGSRVEYSKDKFNMLYDESFRIYCAVGPTSYTQYKSRGLLLDRRHMDGIAFRYQKETLLDLFNPDEVIDTVRPWASE